MRRVKREDPTIMRMERVKKEDLQQQEWVRLLKGPYNKRNGEG
jgi:hypothetical protein